MQSEIFQKLVNLLSNMPIYSYTLWSYVYTLRSVKSIKFFLEKGIRELSRLRLGSNFWVEMAAKLLCISPFLLGITMVLRALIVFLLFTFSPKPHSQSRLEEVARPRPPLFFFCFHFLYLVF
jgi:hypothetical protein